MWNRQIRYKETCKSQQIWEPTRTQKRIQQISTDRKRYENLVPRKPNTHDINHTSAAPDPTPPRPNLTTTPPHLRSVTSTTTTPTQIRPIQKQYPYSPKKHQNKKLTTTSPPRPPPQHQDHTKPPDPPP
ncbi:hypothetical protein QL285_086302 [Trifolium repens]|nr:hypothetical protein QL285_086302 [Trifolium repens]